jgi:hypothetical protein
VPQDTFKINLFLLPEATGGAIPWAAEDYCLAFGPPISADDITYLVQNRDRIEKSLKNSAERPPASELNQFGNRIASALFAGSVGDLYSAAGARPIQTTLCATDTGLKKVPWEYVIWPGTVKVRTPPEPLRGAFQCTMAPPARRNR